MSIVSDDRKPNIYHFVQQIVPMCLHKPPDAPLFLGLPEAPSACVNESVNTVKCLDELELSHSHLCIAQQADVR